MLIASILSCVIAYGYDLGNGTHYVTRSILALALIIAVKAYRASQEA